MALTLHLGPQCRLGDQKPLVIEGLGSLRMALAKGQKVDSSVNIRGAWLASVCTGKTAPRECLLTWMTSRLAAPARPTLMVTGFTRALLAKF